MMSVVIKVENLSKKYILSHQGQEKYTALRDVLTNSVKRIGQKILSPFTHHSSQGSNSPFTLHPSQGSQEEFYALRDVSFEIKQGDRVGIIGRNGAGKSTLLKILSRITEPTSGRIEITGRVASLLEVGTGFHPELTGRENIFLNGAILGMGREEIRRKFDEIVDFAEVERFLDTPVKRYSSGMYVRLAFAVAAHLEPEILIVDEVLAVGDAQFQKKCLGKMEEVGKEGRTVIFVSHNMTALKSLCSRAIWLNAWQVMDDGETDKVVTNYLQNGLSNVHKQTWDDVATAPGNEKVRFHRVELVPELSDSESEITILTPLRLEFEFWNLSDKHDLNFSLHLFNSEGMCIFASASPIFNSETILTRGSCFIPARFMNDGVYHISIMVVQDSTCSFDLKDAIIFEVHEIEREGAWFGKWPGVVRPNFDWLIEHETGDKQ